MTPKEKAKELVKNYSIWAYEDNEGDYLYAAKQCALISVDGIIENGFNPQLPYNYWQEVKQEIINK